MVNISYRIVSHRIVSYNVMPQEGKDMLEVIASPSNMTANDIRITCIYVESHSRGCHIPDSFGDPELEPLSLLGILMLSENMVMMIEKEVSCQVGQRRLLKSSAAWRRAPVACSSAALGVTS